MNEFVFLEILEVQRVVERQVAYSWSIDPATGRRVAKRRPVSAFKIKLTSDLTTWLVSDQIETPAECTVGRTHFLLAVTRWIAEAKGLYRAPESQG